MIAFKSKTNKLGYIKILMTLLPFLIAREFKLRIRFLLAVIFAATTILLNVYTPIILKDIISHFNQTNIAERLVVILLMSYGLIWTLSQIVTQFRQIIMFRVLEQSIRKLTLSVFTKLLKLPMAFHLHKSTGALTNAIERAQNSIPDLFWGIFFLILPVCIEVFIAASILTYKYNLIYGTVLLGILVVFIAVSIATIFASRKIQQDCNQQCARSSAHIVDKMLNYETIITNNRQAFEITQCNTVLLDKENAVTKSVVRMELIRTLQLLIVGMGLTLMTVISGMAVINKTLTVADFILINSYLLQFISPLSNFGYIIRHIYESLNAVEDVVKILHKSEANHDNEEKLVFNGNDYSICFEKVSFAYNLDTPLIKNISFYIPNGKTVAIVGASGAGKTSLVRLLLRIYQQQQGNIYIGKQNVDDIRINSLRDQISIVTQDTLLFNASIRENLLYVNPSANTSDLMKAIDSAKLTNLINSLNDGLDTIVGERGFRLSGGEKQRLSIARLYLRNSPICIFDEATSALDAKTEKQIQQQINQIALNKTTIIIAHRLSTIQYADFVIMLQNGHVVAQGQHDELVNANSSYAQLWNNLQIKEIS